MSRLGIGAPSSTMALLAIAFSAGPALADDLGDALKDVAESGMQEHSSAIDSDSPPDDDAAIAMLGSRDVTVNKDLDTYECWKSLIDGDAKSTFRYGENERVMNRWCHERMWKRKSIPGYRTLGTLQYTREQARPWLEEAAAETGIPYILLDIYISYVSGYRPGVISDTGAQGIMQLRPEVVREMNVKHPLDAKENILAGARYLGKMLDRYDGMFEPSLAALLAGPDAVDRAGGHPPNDKKVIFYVREIRRLYKAQIAEFPMAQGIKDIVYVMTWTEHNRENGDY